MIKRLTKTLFLLVAFLCINYLPVSAIEYCTMTSGCVLEDGHDGECVTTFAILSENHTRVYVAWADDANTPLERPDTLTINLRDNYTGAVSNFVLDSNNITVTEEGYWSVDLGVNYSSVSAVVTPTHYRSELVRLDASEMLTTSCSTNHDGIDDVDYLITLYHEDYETQTIDGSIRIWDFTNCEGLRPRDLIVVSKVNASYYDYASVWQNVSDEIDDDMTLEWSKDYPIYDKFAKKLEWSFELLGKPDEYTERVRKNGREIYWDYCPMVEIPITVEWFDANNVNNNRRGLTLFVSPIDGQGQRSTTYVYPKSSEAVNNVWSTTVTMEKYTWGGDECIYEIEDFTALGWPPGHEVLPDGKVLDDHSYLHEISGDMYSGWKIDCTQYCIFGFIGTFDTTGFPYISDWLHGQMNLGLYVDYGLPTEQLVYEWDSDYFEIINSAYEENYTKYVPYSDKEQNVINYTVLCTPDDKRAVQVGYNWDKALDSIKGETFVKFDYKLLTKDIPVTLTLIGDDKYSMFGSSTCVVQPSLYYTGSNYGFYRETLFMSRGSKIFTVPKYQSVSDSTINQEVYTQTVVQIDSLSHSIIPGDYPWITNATTEQARDYEYQLTETVDSIDVNLREIAHIGGSKIWDDSDNAEGFRPDSVTLNLYKYKGTDKEELLKTQTLTKDVHGEDADRWDCIFGKYPRFEWDGTEIPYSIVEEDINGYEHTYSQEVTDQGKVTRLISTSTHEVDFFDVKVDFVYEDNNDALGLRSNFVLAPYVYKDGVSLLYTGTNENRVYATNCTDYENGQKVDYELDFLCSGGGYTFEVSGDYKSGWIVTCSLDEVTVTVDVLYEDFNNLYGMRPEEIECRLYVEKPVSGSTRILKYETELIQTLNGTDHFEFEPFVRTHPNSKWYVELGWVNQDVNSQPTLPYISYFNGNGSTPTTETHIIENCYMQVVNVPTVTVNFEDKEDVLGLRPDSAFVSFYWNNSLARGPIEITDFGNAQSIGNINTIQMVTMYPFEMIPAPIENYEISSVEGDPINGYTVNYALDAKQFDVKFEFKNDEKYLTDRPEHMMVQLKRDTPFWQRNITIDESTDWNGSFGYFLSNNGLLPYKYNVKLVDVPDTYEVDEAVSMEGDTVLYTYTLTHAHDEPVKEEPKKPEDIKKPDDKDGSDDSNESTKVETESYTSPSKKSNPVQYPVITKVSQAVSNLLAAPQTGDSTNLPLLALGVAVSLLVLVGAIVYFKRKK